MMQNQNGSNELEKCDVEKSLSGDHKDGAANNNVVKQWLEEESNFGCVGVARNIELKEGICGEQTIYCYGIIIVINLPRRGFIADESRRDFNVQGWTG